MFELPLIFGAILKQVDDKEKKINHLVSCWQTVCVSWKRFYENKTERKAIWKLYQELGEQKYKKAVMFLPQLINAKYAPKIDRPTKLWEKLERYKSYINNNEEWKREFAKFVPEEINPEGKKKYQEMRLDLLKKKTLDK